MSDRKRKYKKKSKKLYLIFNMTVGTPPPPPILPPLLRVAGSGGGGREGGDRTFQKLKFFLERGITLKKGQGCKEKVKFPFFFYLGFLSRTFTNHRTAGEEGGHFFNSSLLLPPASQSSPLYIASSRTRTGNLWFPSTSR